MEFQSPDSQFFQRVFFLKFEIGTYRRNLPAEPTYSFESIMPTTTTQPEEAPKTQWEVQAQRGVPPEDGREEPYGRGYETHQRPHKGQG